MSNDRTDGYDGSFETHIRLPLEIAHDLRGIWPKDKPHEGRFQREGNQLSVGADCKLSSEAIHNLFDGIDKDFRPSPEAQSAIVRIEIVGTAASARIDTNDVSGFCFTDFFHLLKVEGKWTVISKIFHTHVAP